LVVGAGSRRRVYRPAPGRRPDPPRLAAGGAADRGRAGDHRAGGVRGHGPRPARPPRPRRRRLLRL